MPAKGQRRKQQIVDTAKKMFVSEGFQSTHIGTICEELNIARGTVYQYFGNKKEIVYAIIEDVEEEFDDIFDIDDFEEYVSQNPDPKSKRQFIVERISACVRALISEPVIIMMLYRQITGIDKEVAESIDSFIDYITKTLVRDMEMLKENGMYEKDADSYTAATMLIGGVMLLSNRSLKDGNSNIGARQVLSVVHHFLDGVM